MVDSEKKPKLKQVRIDADYECLACGSSFNTSADDPGCDRGSSCGFSTNRWKCNNESYWALQEVWSPKPISGSERILIVCALSVLGFVLGLSAGFALDFVLSIIGIDDQEFTRRLPMWGVGIGIFFSLGE